MFVFGIDLPLPEILAFVFFVQIAMLVFIYLEFRKLSSLFNLERMDVSELSKDLAKLGEDVKFFTNDIRLFESLVRGKPQDKLQTYIAHNLGKGVSKVELKTTLVKAGFSQKIVDDALKKAEIKKK